MLTITVEDIGEAVILHCEGRIERGDETTVLCPAMRQEGRSIGVDLAEVDGIDAAGIGALVSLQAAGIYLKLMNPTQQVREILRANELDSIFEISESQAPAATTESTQSGIPDFVYV